MEVFIAVVESGSFAGAAKRLDISSVMVGKLVAQMEAQLQTTLLQRNTRRQHLTESGKVWYEESLNVLATLRAAHNRIDSQRRFPAGSLHISAPSTLGSCVIAGLCSEFQGHFPDVNITLSLSDRFVDIVAEGFDFAIRIGEPAPDSPLVAHKLGEYQMVIAGSPEYLAQTGVPQDIAALSAHRCLRYAGWNKHNVWRSGDVPLWPDNATFTCNDGQALRRAALAGAGLILQPRLLLADDLREGRLVALLEQSLPAPRPVYLLWRQNLHMSARQRSFIDWMRSRAGDALRA
ncbi:LysR family transcriptional regulator [Enterobacteriaceae bacterium 4M9]|nr:LysR family transcriptional regulator [Enterobacteriaceae bacterium 4M9]